MKRFVEGTDRGQNTLFPECLEDWIHEDMRQTGPVRLLLTDTVEKVAKKKL